MVYWAIDAAWTGAAARVTRILSYPIGDQPYPICISFVSCRKGRPVAVPPLGTARPGRCGESPRPRRLLTHHATSGRGAKPRCSWLCALNAIVFNV